MLELYDFSLDFISDSLSQDFIGSNEGSFNRFQRAKQVKSFFPLILET